MFFFHKESGSREVKGLFDVPTTATTFRELATTSTRRRAEAEVEAVQSSPGRPSWARRAWRWLNNPSEDDVLQGLEATRDVADYSNVPRYLMDFVNELFRIVHLHDLQDRVAIVSVPVAPVSGQIDFGAAANVVLEAAGLQEPAEVANPEGGVAQAG